MNVQSDIIAWSGRPGGHRTSEAAAAGRPGVDGEFQGQQASGVRYRRPAATASRYGGLDAVAVEPVPVIVRGQSVRGLVQSGHTTQDGWPARTRSRPPVPHPPVSAGVGSLSGHGTRIDLPPRVGRLDDQSRASRRASAGSRWAAARSTTTSAGRSRCVLGAHPHRLKPQRLLRSLVREAAEPGRRGGCWRRVRSRASFACCVRPVPGEDEA